jgi:uncharacterized protein YegP (UPF0339 family)
MRRSRQGAGAANDPGPNKAASLEGAPKTGPAGRYHFEIHQVRPGNAPMQPFSAASWLWQLVAPSGVAVIECGGYGDEESCRSAVALLQEQAGTAEISSKA